MKHFLLLFIISTFVFASVNPVLENNVPKNNSAVSISQDVKIYPNPASVQVNIESKSTAQIKAVSFYNILGSEVLSKRFTGKNKIQLDVRNLKRGKYLVRVHFTDGTISVANLVKV